MNDVKRCWLCKRTNTQLDRHHVFFGKNRKLSEKYGAIVYLCHNDCHIFGKYAVHNDRANDLRLKEWMQGELMNKYGWTEDEFIKIFGRSYFRHMQDMTFPESYLK